MDLNEPATLRCPTCRALQEWSESCRRCKTDLRLLRDVAEAYRRSRRRCLLQLQAGRPHEALRSARLCHGLRADDESTRLLAVCALLCEDWETAAALTQDPDGA
jgi:hypothetical protein